MRQEPINEAAVERLHPDDVAALAAAIAAQMGHASAPAPAYMTAEELGRHLGGMSAEWVRDNGIHLGATPTNQLGPGRKPRYIYKVSIAEAWMEQNRQALLDLKTPKAPARRGGRKRKPAPSPAVTFRPVLA